MRNIYFILLAFSLNSCIYGSDDDEVIYESSYVPVTLTREVFENNIEVEAARPIGQAGKIYVKDQYIFINEIEEGFHIYNNSNPELPELLAYLKVQGATDLAVRGNTIFVHHLVDLVAITYNFQDQTIISTNRSVDVFPQLSSPDGFPASFFKVPENEIIIGYQLKN